MAKKIESPVEVFYTGGGIWTAIKHIDGDIYVMVDNDFPECLTAYDGSKEEEYFTEMLWSKGIDEMNEEERHLHAELTKALGKEAN